jgi:hypothetical protein
MWMWPIKCDLIWKRGDRWRISGVPSPMFSLLISYFLIRWRLEENYDWSSIYSGFYKTSQLQLASHSSSYFISTTMVDVARPHAANSSRHVTTRACRMLLVERQTLHWDNAETINQWESQCHIFISAEINMKEKLSCKFSRLWCEIG